MTESQMVLAYVGILMLLTAGVGVVFAVGHGLGLENKRLRAQVVAQKEARR